MISILVLSILLAQVQPPASPPTVTSREASPALVSSGEDAYVSWTVDAATKRMNYDVSVDDAPWVAVSGPKLKQVPVAPADSRTIRRYGVNLGKLAPGPHTVRVRECDASRKTCAAAAAATVTVAPPVACAMGPWSDWTDWTNWVRVGAVEKRSHSRYRAITTFPDKGAAPCPANIETVEATRPYVPPPLDPLTVTYVRLDRTTQGTWKGVYGSQGVVLAAAAPGSLPFVTVTPIGAEVWTWAPQTTDPRALQPPATASGNERAASAWYAAGPFELDVRFNDPQIHEVALYTVDWDGLGRVQTIEVMDSQGVVRHTLKTGKEIATGVYYVYLISGHARIRVTRTAGANGVVFGLLFAPAPGPAAK